MDKLFQLDIFGNEIEIKEEVKMDIEQDLINIHKIESEKKIEKLLEELIELSEAITIYMHDQTKENLIECLKESFDVLSILCQLGIVRYGMKLAEIKVLALQIIARGVIISKRIRIEGRSYRVLERSINNEVYRSQRRTIW